MARKLLAADRRLWNVWAAHGPQTGAIVGYWVVKGAAPDERMTNVRATFGQARWGLPEAKRRAEAAAIEANFLGA